MSITSSQFFKLSTAILLLLGASLSGCSSSPDYPAVEVANNHHPGVSVATRMLGIPYQYGGASPRGFDCSGLVYYSYRKAGITLPRTTSEQFRHSRKVSTTNLHPGDLLFFKLGRQSVSHVAIYTGNGRFIHAPSSGKRVSYATMSNPYWKNRLVSAGRY